MFNHIKADMHRILLRKGFLNLTAILIAVSVLAVLGFSSQYSAEKVLSFYPAINFLLFLLISVVVNDYTLKEELYLKVIKNDMNTGVSRSQYYTSKFLSGVILIVTFWLVLSIVISVAAGFAASPEQAIQFFGGLFSLQQFLMILQVLFFVGVFQLFALFIQKTVLMLLICGVVQQGLNSIAKTVPHMQDILNKYNTGDFVSVFLTVLGIIAIVWVGCLLFNKKEL
ncbi:hypothetical protein ACFFNY_21195 [Paenibacillus hodogayensis]|uniref:ABC transporter permease n=1 Tax=Paenibacillus hodogayensis TaxID=279208 RepID=A0ABV5W0L0_9BACL